jgi:hypothetical protein
MRSRDTVPAERTPPAARPGSGAGAAQTAAGGGGREQSLRWASARLWLASLALVVPAAWPYVLHFLDSSRGMATGFIGIDMPVYMASAREHFDAGGLAYGNPSSPFYDTPAIYFQPMTLLLGLIWRFTGLDPGLVFVGFGLIAAVVCVRVAVALYRQLVGLESWVHWAGLLMFVWGGGALVLAGLAYNTVAGDPSGSLLRFDPGGGWWFLNLGRNLVFPTEALYHALFLGCILALFRRRFGVALLMAAVVAISHPFTGVQLLLILTVWCGLEWFFLRSDALPRSFVLGCGALFTAHLGYYLLFLSRFPEHRALMEQWAQPWVYHAANFVPAYLLVGGLALWRMRRIGLARDVLGTSGNRLLLMWFAVSFVLANHEFAIKPLQPAHFTRGYVWMPLFLLGAPVLMGLLATLWSSRRRVLGALSAATIVGLFLADNAVWLAARTAPIGVYMTTQQRELFTWMDATEHRGAVVLAEHNIIGYLTTVYTPLRAWQGHLFNTPHGHQRRLEARAFFQDGVFLDDWRGIRLLIVYDNEDPVEPGRDVPADLEAATRFRNDRFTVVEVNPGGAPARFRGVGQAHGEDHSRGGDQ